MSLPLWERGLKYHQTYPLRQMFPSLPLWERGLKLLYQQSIQASDTVAPLVGAWIEITMPPDKKTISLSLPLWERGLKFLNFKDIIPQRCRSPCGSVD